MRKMLMTAAYCSYLLLFLMLSLCVSAQTGTGVHGTIKDENGKPLAGATVKVKGSRSGTTTDVNGHFDLPKATQGSTLVISYVGYSDREMRTSADGLVDLSLERKVGMGTLDEVVVIGYGAARKRDLVSSTDVVSAKDAGNTASTNPSELLIGKAAGVQVVQANGTPGSDAQVIIRGTGSFTSVDPLYVIDGIEADKNLFNALSSQDIDNITIMKDAASTAIYGSAAANGVVIITTKKGKSGPPRVSFTSQWGTSKAWRQLDMLNAAQYVDLLKDYAATLNTSLPAKFSGPTVLVDSNNWEHQIFRSALVSENDINISGGSDKVTYSLSTGYITQESIVKALINKRLNIRIALDENLGRFRLGQSVTLRNTNTNGQMATISDALQYAPYKPIYDPTIPGGYSITTNVADFNGVNNPVQDYNVQHPNTNEFVLFPQVYGEVGLINGLKFRTQFSAEVGYGKYQMYQFPYTAGNSLAFPREAILGYNDYSYYTWENYFTYTKAIGAHHLSLTAGNSYLSPGNSSNLQATGSNIPNDNIQNISVSQTQSVTGVGYNYARPSVISYFGRAQYSFNEKYFLSASVRRDGASNFGSANQFGNFPAFGAAWRFTEESFAKKALSFINEGKLRVGWGRTGNNLFKNFLTVPLTFGGSPNGNLVYTLGSNEAFVPGTTIASVANPNLRWEETDQTDLGLDLSLLNNHLSVSVDYYNRKSTGLLVSIQLPGSGGAALSGANPIELENAADAYNRGVEFTLGYTGRGNKDLTYNVNFNGAINKNQVTSLGSQFAAPILAGSFSQLSTFTITEGGAPIGSYYGYLVDHVAKDQAEIDALNAAAQKKTGNAAAVYQAGLLPGDFIFKDINGDGTVTSTDQKLLGNPIPKFVYGFNAGVTFKNFDLNLVISGVSGLKILNAMKFITQTEATGHNATTAILNRWEQSGDVAALPRAGQDATGSGNLRPSDWWLENGSYLRVRNLTVGYTIPRQLLGSLTGNTFTRIRLYVAAQNLLTITGYSGYDPEISTQTGGDYIFTRGIDDGQLPQPRTFLAGLQLGF